MEHNPFDRNHHRDFPRKQKGNALGEQFGHRPLSSLPPLDHSYSWICGAPRGCLHSGR